MAQPRHLTAKQATEALGISAATLYAYVSRGLIRSEAIEGDGRARTYNAEDVQRLRDRKAQRKNPGEAVRAALHWGMPVLESGLALIAEGGLYYRGYDALELARTRSVEEVAALLWSGDLDGGDRLFASATAHESVWSAPGDMPPIPRMQIALALAGAGDLGAYDLRPEMMALTGARILRLMAAAAAGNQAGMNGTAHTLAEGWGIPDETSVRLLNAALILCADHELNISSFAARVAASGEAPLYAVVAAGLAALQGAKHGGLTRRAEALLREMDGPAQADRAISDRLRRGEIVPGFGHPLYPDGDPRARLLLALIEEAMPGSPVVGMVGAISARMMDAVQLHPTIDLGLAALACALGLPADAAICLFAVGRTIGWVGHAIEQVEQGRMIRPRASYVGPPIRRTDSDE